MPGLKVYDGGANAMMLEAVVPPLTYSARCRVDFGCEGRIREARVLGRAAV